MQGFSVFIAADVADFISKVRGYLKNVLLQAFDILENVGINLLQDIF
jgi:hypothetical protein